MDYTSWKVLLIISITTKGRGSYFIFINEHVSWLEAQSKCHSYDKGFLIHHGQEVYNKCTRQHFKGIPKYWLGMYTRFTPYISHKGCYQIPQRFNIDESRKKEIQYVGECYEHCSESNYTRFGITNKQCVCLNEPEVNLMTQSDKRSCSITCNAFKEEYCGGERSFSVYFVDRRIKDGDGRCIYFECPGSYGQFHDTDCTDRLEGRVCGNSTTHRNPANFTEARLRCQPAYLNSSTDCVSDALQAGVKYWLDIRKYEVLKFDSQDLNIPSEVTHSCLLRTEDRFYFRNCSNLNHAVCITEKVESSEYPFCSNETDESNTVSGNTVVDTTEKTMPSSQNDGATIWGPILGTITVLTGCIIGIVVYYRSRRKAIKNDGSDIKENTSDEGPNRNYFVLEANAAKRESTIKNNTNYDNAYQQCDLASSSAKVSVNEESVYAEQPDDVYDELNKRRRENKTKYDQNETIYGDNMVDTVADNGVYNTLDSGIHKTDIHVPYTIDDSEGYGHLKIDGLKRSTDSNYDHC